MKQNISNLSNKKLNDIILIPKINQSSNLYINKSHKQIKSQIFQKTEILLKSNTIKNNNAQEKKNIRNKLLNKNIYPLFSKDNLIKVGIEKNDSNKQKNTLEDNVSKTEKAIIFLPIIQNNQINCSTMKINKRSRLFKNFSSKNIYEYYKRKESQCKIKRIKDFDKFIEKKYKNPKKRLEDLYCIDYEFLKYMKELKNNRNIAYKDDFNILDYQNALMEIVRRRIDEKIFYDLGENFKEFNEKMSKNFSPKGRYTNLAYKIRNHVPLHLINRLHKLDKDKLLMRAKFLKAKIDLNKKNESNNQENIFAEFKEYLKNKFVSDKKE